MKILLIILPLVMFSCKSREIQENVVLTGRNGAGMFSELDNVWSVLDCYERKLCKKVTVDFRTDGPYFDAKYGTNWFSYYFEPINLGNSEKSPWYSNDPSGHNTNFMHPEPIFSNAALHESEIKTLIKKYIKIKPEILEIIDVYKKDNFKDSFVIGIHYRGTDKKSEAPRVPYHRVVEAVKQQIKERQLKNYKIFVATDEQAFLDEMSVQFHDKVLSWDGTERSTDGTPLHLGKTSKQYEMGKNALIDCLLLSKTDLLIRTSSNLSRWSTYFNPNIPIIELSRRYEDQ